MSIFKTCDIRGVYGRDLDIDIAYRLGRAVATREAGKTIVVGGDVRLSTPALKEALIAGLLQSGAEVIDLGTLPTPAFYYGKHLLKAHGGLMVTASHNPPRYNGFKLMFGELPITPEALQEVAGVMEAGAWREGSGTLQRRDVLADYQDSLVQAFRGLAPHRLVVDAGNGSMGPVAPDVLRALGQDVVELYCEPNGAFPNRDPNPAVPAHLAALCQRVRDTDADLGIAFDGDGDRVIFVDEEGAVQPADRALVLMARAALADQPGGKVVYDLKCSSAVVDEIAAAGGVALMERSGHAFIKHRLLEEGAILGGEISGHYFFAEIGGDDALYATLVMLRVLDELGSSFAEACQSVPAYPITPDLRLPCAPERARQILAALERAFADRPISHLDGVRIQFADGWALARLSVTEPLITLRFEARNETRLQEIIALVRQAVPDLDVLFAQAGL